MNMPYGWHGGYYNDEYVDYEYSGDYDYDDYEDYNGFTVGDSVEFDSSYPIHKADFKDTIPYSAASQTAAYLDVDMGGVGFYVKNPRTAIFIWKA